jgi:hypothetical protein
MRGLKRAAARCVEIPICLGLLATTVTLAAGAEQPSPWSAPARLPAVMMTTYVPTSPNAFGPDEIPPVIQQPTVAPLSVPPEFEDTPPALFEPELDSDDSLAGHHFPPTVPPLWFADVEFLMIRPVLSDAIAFLSGTLDPNTNQLTGTLTTFDYNYEPAARAVFGYRSPETFGGVQFTYWHLAAKTAADFTSTRQDDGYIANAYIPFTPVAVGGPGASIETALQLRLDLYDVEYFRSFASDDDSWYARGSIGVRIANFGQRTSMVASDDTGSIVLDQTIGLGFTGAGPRLALEGRRNLGSNTALYVRGGYALLLGQRNANVDTAFTGQAPSINVDERSARAVTVGDLELGAAWQPLEHCVLSVGWILQGWTNLNGFQQNLNVANNANILALDGLSVRAEVNW